MTKDILLRISGVQFGMETGPEPEETPEIIAAGSYFEKNGQKYIKYNEFQGDCDDVMKNLIKIREDSMEVVKKGPVNVHMVFEKGKKNEAYYQTPFGDLLVGISTTHMEMHEKENELAVKVEYALEVNCEFLADCSISLNVQSKA